MAYETLAAHYDRFTQDVDYSAFVAYYKKAWDRAGISPALTLDLACGTGTISHMLAEDGYEVIGVDASPEMLMEAYSKMSTADTPPVFINQRMDELDLYGTINAVVCALDSVNYITDPEELLRAFEKVSLFMEPDGVFIFDANTDAKFISLDGTAYTREDENTFCVYQLDYEDRICVHTVDIFEKHGKTYRRTTEYHEERGYTISELTEMLRKAGFDRIEACKAFSFDPAEDNEHRVFFLARKPKE